MNAVGISVFSLLVVTGIVAVLAAPMGNGKSNYISNRAVRDTDAVANHPTLATALVSRTKRRGGGSRGGGKSGGGKSGGGGGDDGGGGFLGAVGDLLGLGGDDSGANQFKVKVPKKGK